jgi:hypothetical protein
MVDDPGFVERLAEAGRLGGRRSADSRGIIVRHVSVKEVSKAINESSYSYLSLAYSKEAVFKLMMVMVMDAKSDV